MTTSRALPYRLHRCTSGATAVEFALVIIPFLLTIFGLLEFARAYNAQSSLEWVADRINREFVIDDEKCDAFTNNLAGVILTSDRRGEFMGGRSDLLAIAESGTSNGRREFELSYPINLFLPFTEIETLELTATRITSCSAS